LPSEISSLPDLCGYIKLSGDLPCAPVRLPLPAHRDDVAEAFCPAERPAAPPPPQAKSQTKEAPAPQATPAPEPDLPF
jgi:hypothetical protein